MEVIKLLEDDAKLKVIKWVGKLLLNAIKPYLTTLYEHPRLFPLHVILFLFYYHVRTWLNKKAWSTLLEVKRLTKEAKEDMFKILVLLVVAIVLDRNKGKLEPMKVYRVNDLAGLGN